MSLELFHLGAENSTQKVRISLSVSDTVVLIGGLQDPVARAYSAWQMTMREMCPPGTESCPVKSFAAGVQDELDADEERGCLFNVPVRSSYETDVCA